MKKLAPFVLLLLVMAAPAIGSAIKTWTTGETLRAADLNSNFAHIHNAKVGDGVLLVNADVSASAAIAHSKMATPSLLPKAKATVETATGASCSGSPCTLVEAVNITSVTRSGAGDYVVTVTTPGADANYNAQITLARDGAVGNCTFASNTASTFGVKCYDNAGAPADRRWSIVLWDN